MLSWSWVLTYILCCLGALLFLVSLKMFGCTWFFHIPKHPMMLWYNMNTIGTHGRDTNFTHRKWSIGYDMAQYITYFDIAYFEVSVHHKKHQQDEWDPKAINCIFVGYLSSQKRCKCYLPKKDLSNCYNGHNIPWRHSILLAKKQRISTLRELGVAFASYPTYALSYGPTLQMTITIKILDSREE